MDFHLALNGEPPAEIRLGAEIEGEALALRLPAGHPDGEGTRITRTSFLLLRSNPRCYKVTCERLHREYREERCSRVTEGRCLAGSVSYIEPLETCVALFKTQGHDPKDLWCFSEVYDILGQQSIVTSFECPHPNEVDKWWDERWQFLDVR